MRGEQIALGLRQGDLGTQAAEICRKMDMTGRICAWLADIAAARNDGRSETSDLAALSRHTVRLLAAPGLRGAGRSAKMQINFSRGAATSRQPGVATLADAEAQAAPLAAGLTTLITIAPVVGPRAMRGG